MEIVSIKNSGEYLNIIIFANRGSSIEKFGNNGYTHILEHCLLELCSQNEEYMLQAYTEFDHMEIHFISANNTLEGCEQIFLSIEQILISGELSEQVLERAKLQVKSEIEEKRTENLKILRLMQKISDGDISTLPIGSIDDIEKLTIEKMQVFRKKFFEESNCRILICGNVTYDQIKEILPDKIKIATKKEHFIKSTKKKYEFKSECLIGKDTLQKLICMYDYQTKTIRKRLIQIIGDQLIEKCAIGMEELNCVTMEYKYINKELKLLILSLYYKDSYAFMLELKDFISLIRNNVREEDFFSITKKTKQLFLEYFQYESTVTMLTTEIKNNFLYEEAEIFNSVSQFEIEECINSIYYQDIIKYITKLADLKCKYLFEANREI